MVHSLWGNKEVMWTSKNSIGRPGGMIMMWKPNLFKVFSIFEGERFIGIQLNWKDSLCMLFASTSRVTLVIKGKVGRS